jgi:hypothetical protein
MAVAIAPKIQVQLSGDSICPINQIKSWELLQKKEMIKTIKANDSDVTLDFDDIENMELLYFYSDDTFNIKLTVQTGSGQNIVTSVVEIPVTGFFILNTLQAFMNEITAFEINTDSTTDIDIVINAYGKPTV